MKDIGAILCPAMPIPAVKHTESRKLLTSAAYMLGCNAYNLCGGIVPVSLSTKEEELYDINDCYANDSIFRAAQRSLENSEGMPICV